MSVDTGKQTPLTQLGPLSVGDFMRDYWQKTPVFLPAALNNFHSPLTPEELAGLAMEEGVEARLVTHSESQPWQLHTGPFGEHDFTSLPEDGWTLLVQAVDHWVPEVAALLDKFRFIPNWRLDDVMVSYAPTGASVGPHFDYYDVFLVQGAGQREWQIGQHCDTHSPTLSNSALKILRDFEPAQSFTAKPGDIVYIPPGIAHWGRALDNDCMTYSIGFRAPSHSDIISEFAQDIASILAPEQRFLDPTSAPTTDSGRIDSASLEHLQNIISQQLTRDNIGQWFGRYMSEPKYIDDTGVPEHTLSDTQAQEQLTGDANITRSSASRFCYLEQHGQCTLFVDGEAHTCSLALAQTLCQHRQWPASQLAAFTSDTLLLRWLLSKGSLCSDGER